MLSYDHRLKLRARALRTNPTDAELHLWHRLRRKQILAVQFYRQKAIGIYIVDFYAPAAKLVIEVDGGHHVESRQAKYDQVRAEYLERQGLRVLRFDDREVLLQTESVLEAIYQALKNPSKPPFAKGRDRQACRCVRVCGRKGANFEAVQFHDDPFPQQAEEAVLWCVHLNNLRWRFMS